jgi:hypothetical protein
VRVADQVWRAGGEVRSEWCRTSAVSKWEMEGRVQNLNSVAMDWGSVIPFVRRVVLEAKV